jgi:hypothetical protein
MDLRGETARRRLADLGGLVRAFARGDCGCLGALLAMKTTFPRPPRSMTVLRVADEGVTARRRLADLGGLVRAFARGDRGCLGALLATKITFRDLRGL